MSTLVIAATAFLVTGRKPQSKAPAKSLEKALNQPKKQFISTYKALMMLYTSAAILAVDFPMFPRRFAKVETYGISLMDIGVGSFIFVQGIVSAGHKSKSRQGFIGRSVKSLRSSFPLIILGLTRLVFVKTADYQEHVSEYGVHWNFFLTLSMLPPLVTITQYIFDVDEGILGCLTALAYQYALTYIGLENFIIDSPRTDFLSSNREGILGLVGYLSLFLVAKRIGRIFVNSDFKTLDEWKNIVRSSVFSSLILNLAYLVASYIGFQTSRRMVRLSFNSSLFNLYS